MAVLPDREPGGLGGGDAADLGAARGPAWLTTLLGQVGVGVSLARLSVLPGGIPRGFPQPNREPSSCGANGCVGYPPGGRLSASHAATLGFGRRIAAEKGMQSIGVKNQMKHNPVVIIRERSATICELVRDITRQAAKLCTEPTVCYHPLYNTPFPPTICG